MNEASDCGSLVFYCKADQFSRWLRILDIMTITKQEISMFSLIRI